MKKNLAKLNEALAIVKRERNALDHLEIPKKSMQRLGDYVLTAKLGLERLAANLDFEIQTLLSRRGTKTRDD